MRLLLSMMLLISFDLSAANITLNARQRDSDSGAIVERPVQIDPQRLGVVVVDMWNWHWCKTSTMRVAALVPRMNRSLDELRALGAQVFMCPTDVADNYAGTPQLESVLAVEPVPLPKPRVISCPAAPDGGGCTCGPGHRCAGNYGWDGMHPDLRMDARDLMPNDPEMLYAILKKRGITHLIFMGVHTQVCLLGKSIGMRAMLEAGFHCFLARDLTDAHGKYDPEAGLTPDIFTANVVAHFEKHLAPSIDMAETLRAANRWDTNAAVDYVRIAPWGTMDRPQHFENRILVALGAPWRADGTIRFTVDGAEPTADSPAYSQPISIDKTTTLKTRLFAGAAPVGLPSEAFFVRQNPLPPPPDIQLSALTPRRSVGPGHSPSFKDHRFAPISNPPQINLSNRKQPLRMRGQTYASGIGVHAPNQLIYDLEPGYSRFVAVAGIDDRIIDIESGTNLAMHPSVIFRVFIDGQLAAESPLMRISEPPWHFDVPIPPGAKMISLATTDGGNGNKEDVADWVNAGFIKK